MGFPHCGASEGQAQQVVCARPCGPPLAAKRGLPPQAPPSSPKPAAWVRARSETPCIKNKYLFCSKFYKISPYHTACRFVEKTRFFRSLWAGRRCAAASFKGETLEQARWGRVGGLGGKGNPSRASRGVPLPPNILKKHSSPKCADVSGCLPREWPQGGGRGRYIRRRRNLCSVPYPRRVPCVRSGPQG